MPLTDGERYSTRIPVYNVGELRNSQGKKVNKPELSSTMNPLRS
jgi:hypothetical protein